MQVSCIAGEFRAVSDHHPSGSGAEAIGPARRAQA